VAKAAITLLKTGVERCVQRGIDADYVVAKPAAMVKTLVRAGLLPSSAFVERFPDPAGRTTRSALFGVMPLDLGKRKEDIEDYVDSNEHLFELKDGSQVMAHLAEMLGRAMAARPDLYDSDAAAQIVFTVIGTEQVFRDLMRGETSLFVAMLRALKGAA
jgi:hypothetical protein